jgi:iron-sulfur cluster repair protein YtfE (RIC family)
MNRITGAPDTPERPLPITGRMRINEVIGRHPQTVRPLGALGFDTCCGGERTIEDACARHGLAVDPVLEVLNDVVTT